MPCRSEYLEPTAKENETRLVAQLLSYVLLSLYPNQAISEELRMSATVSYPNVSFLDRYTRTLCENISNMSDEQLNRIVYDGRNPQARELANWWDRHQDWDRRRKEEKAAKLSKEKLQKSGLKKLTTEEKKALGLRY